MFALLRVWNDLVALRRQHIDKYRHDSQRWFSWLPTPLPAPVSFDTASLAYLFELEGSVAKNLPLEVHIELSRYEAIYGAAIERNKVHSGEAQPAIERGQRTVEGPLGLHGVLVAVLGGDRVLKTLQGLTDQLIEQVDASIESIPATTRKLYEVARAAAWYRSGSGHTSRRYPPEFTRGVKSSSRRCA